MDENLHGTRSSHGTAGGSGGGSAGGSGGGAHDRLTEEARATASALLEWIGSRVDRAAAPGGPGARPAQSPAPCTWCPVCAVVAALRGEQPELTGRMAEQASAIMMLLRVMVQSHTGPAGHTHPHSHSHEGADGAAAPSAWPPGAWASDPWVTDPWAATPGARDRRAHQAAADDEAGSAPGSAWDLSWPPAGEAPPGWPAEWGAPSSAATPGVASAGSAGHLGTVGDPEPAAECDPAILDPIEEASGPAPHARGARPGPRRAPARTTSPRQASPRPSAVRTPRPAPRRAADTSGTPGPAGPVRSTATASAEPATGATEANDAARGTGRVQRIAVRRATDPGS